MNKIINTKTANFQPLVSIAMITYNHERFIANAIDSVLTQDYHNIEIIISDDLSTDKTIEIINKYTEQYFDKIKLLTAEKNVGAAANWFKCVSACTGKYVIGLSGDDEFYPDILFKQATIMENDSDIAMSYTDAAVVDFLTQKVLYKLSDKTPHLSGNITTALINSLYYSPTIMFCKNLLPKENIFKNIRHGADLAFYKELMILSAPNGKLVYLPEVLYKYQKHDMNITVSGWAYRKEHIVAIKILQKKYPEYSEYLAPAIYDFCCVAFCKSLFRFNFIDAKYFLVTGLRASKWNFVKFFRAIIWGVKFFLGIKP